MGMGIGMDAYSYGLDVPLIWCNYYRLCPMATRKKEKYKKKKGIKRGKKKSRWLWLLIRQNTGHQRHVS